MSEKKKINLHKGFYILRMWQTGNIGSNNICRVYGQPEDGFLIYRDAEKWMYDNIDQIDSGLWDEYLISMIYIKTKTL